MAQGPGPASVSDADLFEMRWARAGADLCDPLARLYGQSVDLETFYGRLKGLLAASWAARPAALRALDLQRDLTPGWFLSQEMVGYVFYVDRFCGRLKDLPNALPYLADLGVTYAHLMPLLQPRPGESDGGYAVMDYGAVDPRLGSLADLEAAAAAMRGHGISPCIDIVLNHTAQEHDWAQKARAGDPFYQAFYRMFDSEAVPRAYEAALVDIFPVQAPGSFTHVPEIGKWVWTTFNRFQWDLNWENPEVFLAVLKVILDLANRGVEVMRLDAVAFLWKRMGTACQNLPEVYDILQALVQASRVAAPAVLHKAEAIVGPEDLVPYLGQGRHAGRVAQLAYHNTLMVQFWAALASRDTRLMTFVLRKHFPPGFKRASWATYLRCHDDIGWAITEADAAVFPPMTGAGHRTFLANFYNGSFPGSFAMGEDFQSNPGTGDRRTNGTTAALAGLEAAVLAEDRRLIDLAVNRILMGHALIAAFGGMPLIYMGDELGLPNDGSYLDDPDLAGDGRWMQRPFMDWEKAERAGTAQEPSGWLYRGIRHILHRRKALPALAGDVPTEVIDTGHRAVFALRRPGDGAEVTAVFNLTEAWQELAVADLGLVPGQAYEALSEAEIDLGACLSLPPYARLWLLRAA